MAPLILSLRPTLWFSVWISDDDQCSVPVMKSLCHLSRAICRMRVVYYRAELPGSSGVVPPSPLKPDYIERTTQKAGQNKVKGQRSDVVAKRCPGGVRLPASDWQTRPLHQPAAGFTDPLCTKRIRQVLTGQSDLFCDWLIKNRY